MLFVFTTLLGRKACHAALFDGSLLNGSDHFIEIFTVTMFSLSERYYYYYCLLVSL